MQLEFLKNARNKLHSGATVESLHKVEETLSVSLPCALKEFLTFSDGALIADRMILFSAQPNSSTHEDFISFNNQETVKKFLRIGRFSADEFGYLASDLNSTDPAICVFDHETGECHPEASDLLQLLKKYNDYVPPKKKWYSFLFSTPRS